jgi:DNA-binding MarR family transcriptional regulator
MSELLDRIQREIRERLEASRAAVREHERLEAALQALGGAGSRATRVVRGSGRGMSAPVRPPSAAAKPSSSARARSRKQSPAVPRSGASAKARQPASATADGRSRPARRSGGRAARPSGTKKGQVARAADAGPAARKRAPRGANREAVLVVVGERPGVTARELAAASGVTGGTLYSLLRTLTQQGALQKRELPGGQTGYEVAVTAAGAQAAVAPAATTTEASADAESGPARLEQDRARSTQTDNARSARGEAHATEEQANAPADADDRSGQEAAK